MHLFKTMLQSFSSIRSHMDRRAIYMRGIILSLLLSSFGFAIEIGDQISNQASVVYSLQDHIKTNQTNEVNVTIGTIPATLEFLRYSHSGGEGNITIKPTRYKAKSSNKASQNKISKSGDRFVLMPPPKLSSGKILNIDNPVSVTAGELYSNSDLVIVKVIDIEANRNRAGVESLEVNIDNNGDSELIKLEETHKDSGIFVGYIQVVSSEKSSGDGMLFVQPNNTIVAKYGRDGVVTEATLDSAKIIPDAKVFLSKDGTPLPNIEVFLLDPETKEILYSTVTDGEGRYHFDDVVAGDYILYSSYIIAPEPIIGANGTAVGGATLHSGYIPFAQEITQGSTGPMVAMDIPISIEQKAVIWIEKEASKDQVGVGEFVRYKLSVNNDSEDTVYNLMIKDFLPKGLKYEAKSFKVKGVKREVQLSEDGKIIHADLGELEGKERVEVSYVATVTTDASSKEITNRALVSSNNIVVSNIATSTVKFKRELFTDKGVIVGQIFDTTYDKNSTAIMGVKLYMEDGFYVVSDHKGKYHFEGVNLGRHVVQVDRDILTEGYEVVACQDEIQSNASPFSKFVKLNHGALKRVDFCIKKVREVASSQPKVESKTKRVQAKMPEYMGADISTLKASQDILWPKEGYIPAIPSTNLAVLHPKNQKVELWLNGEKVSLYNFDSTIMGLKKQKMVTLYKGIDLLEGDNAFEVHFLTKSGKRVATQKRVIHISGSPAKLLYHKEDSKLVADGKVSPVIAVQFFDIDGYPLRAGMQGSFSIDSPYVPQSRIDSLKLDPLALSSHSDKFKIDTNGTAYIKLQPTSKSGEVKLYFTMENGRKEIVKAWLKPKARDWIMVGFAEGTIGYEKLSKNQEQYDKKDEFYKEGRVAFFAKGKIKGSWLLSLAYDSGKEVDEDKLGAEIDPNAYYTLYGDATQQNHEASTQKKLFVKLEKDNFYALFGDFETGLTSTELTQYSRSFTGVKSEYHGEFVEGSAFVSNSDQQFGRDEIRGDGTSGYYYLSKKNLILNSERITIEVRDRYHNEVMVSQKTLRRYQDYDIDYTKGSLYFKTPIYSKDSNFNPQYIVVTYEVRLDSVDGYSYGGRVALKPNDNIEIGSVLVEENQGVNKNSMVGVDAKAKIGTDITLRAEYAMSSNKDAKQTTEGSAKLVELDYIGSGVQAMAYYREQDNAFGLGQLSEALGATRKIGVEANRRFARWYINTTVFRDESLESESFSDMVQMNLGYGDSYWNSTVGYRYVKTDKDEGANQLMMMLSRSLFDHKLRLSVSRDQTIGAEESELYPTKTMAQVSYSILPSIEIFGTYELSEKGEEQGTQSRMGVRATPWQGATLESSRVSEFEDDVTRVYDVMGIAQRVKLNESLGFDVGYESSKGVDGNVSDKDFIAYNAGISYQSQALSGNIRAELREGNDRDSVNLQSAVYTKATESLGLALGGSYSKSESIEEMIRQADAKVALAYRPQLTNWIVLSRLAYIDSVTNREDDALQSSKLVSNNFINFMPSERLELSLSYGLKFLIDTMEEEEYKSFVNYLGLDVNYDLTPKFEMGLHGSLLEATSANNRKQSAGAYLGYNAFDNAWFYLGYNFVGFREDDFSLQNYDRDGIYLRIDMKFDQESLKKVAGGLLSW